MSADPVHGRPSATVFYIPGNLPRDVADEIAARIVATSTQSFAQSVASILRQARSVRCLLGYHRRAGPACARCGTELEAMR